MHSTFIGRLLNFRRSRQQVTKTSTPVLQLPTVPLALTVSPIVSRHSRKGNRRTREHASKRVRQQISRRSRVDQIKRGNHNRRAA